MPGSLGFPSKLVFVVVFKDLFQLGVVVHVFNPSTWEADAGGFLSSRPAWSTE
jgi:major histocompatibility complex class I